MGATTTVTGSTHVLGSLGSGGATGTASVTGSVSLADAAYTSAFTDFKSVMSNAGSQVAEYTLTSDLGGQTFTPGVYNSTNAVSIGSSIKLDGDGVYIFQIGGALTTAANTHIQLENGAQACNIYWVADVATIGANSTFQGTLMSKSAITVGANSVTNGRILAQTAVTANAANTRINVPAECASVPTPDPTTPDPTTPDPATPDPTTPDLTTPDLTTSDPTTPDLTTPDLTTPDPTTPGPTTPTPVPTPVLTPTPEQPSVSGPLVAECTSTSVNVKMDSKGNMIIHALLPNDAKGTGTWTFNIGGKMYEVKGNEEITYTAVNVPVGTYKVDVQFTPDDNGEVVDLASCTVSVPTVTGGQLPKTSTPWYNLLLAGAVLSMTGLALFIRRKIHA